MSFVDVPGHARFLPNLLAGVGGVVACLFVVDAGEGWRPQSEEHLRILELVGVGHGVVALTKADRVEALPDIRPRLAGTFLADAPMVAVSVKEGRGLGELRRALATVLAAVPAVVDRDRPRLWVDRAFAARGAGTVVTGTLLDGSVAVGDRLAIRPEGPEVRVRGIQAHHEAVEELAPGSRCALNLVGVEHTEVRRGQAVVRPGQWHETEVVDATLRVLAGLDHGVSRRGAYTVHVGSAAVPVRLRLLRDDDLVPGASGPARLRLGQPLPLLPGDHFVLRESGRGETVGGGEVLDVDPVVPPGRARPDRSVDRVVAERGWITADDLERRTGERRPGRWVVAPAVVDDLRARLEAGTPLAELDERERDLAEAEGLVAAEPEVPYLAALAASPFSPPGPEGVPAEDLRALARTGGAVAVDGTWFAATAVDAAAEVARRLLADHPGGFTVAQLRDALGTTRKHAVPLAELLDRRGVTIRRGDLRLPGPEA